MRAGEPVEALARRLHARAGAIPLLALRVPALERTAWREGLRAARALERRASVAFASAVGRVLRADDLLGHDWGSDVFVAALAAPVRDGERDAAPPDVRRALRRLATTIERATELAVDAGWTRYVPEQHGGIASAIGDAIVRGAHERERYAFFCSIGHELRTPLASIRGLLETLLDDALEPDARRRFVEIAFGESLRLGRLLDGMFEISLLDLGASAAPASRCDLGPTLERALAACAVRAAARGVEVQGDAPALAVVFEGEQLALALVNLLDNAIKHGRPAGRVTIRADARARGTVTLVIDDDGPGIPLQDRERIFGLGTRGSTAAPGSGIGLALVRMILERAGGSIEAGEAPGGGARFTLALPRA